MKPRSGSVAFSRKSQLDQPLVPAVPGLEHARRQQGHHDHRGREDRARQGQAQHPRDEQEPEGEIKAEFQIGDQTVHFGLERVNT